MQKLTKPFVVGLLLGTVKLQAFPSADDIYGAFSYDGIMDYWEFTEAIKEIICLSGDDPSTMNADELKMTWDYANTNYDEYLEYAEWENLYNMADFGSRELNSCRSNQDSGGDSGDNSGRGASSITEMPSADDFWMYEFQLGF